MSALALGLTAGGLFAVSGLQAYQQGQYNQEVAQQQATAARQANRFNSGIRREQFAAQQGADLARTMASGVDIAGSPLQQRIANRYRFLQDEAAMEFNTEVGAQQSEARGELDRFKGVAGLGTSLLRSGLEIGEGIQIDNQSKD